MALHLTYMHRIAVVVAALAVAGCRVTEPDATPNECRQTYEFGNSGCADLVGVVTDESGAPLVGAYVGWLQTRPDRGIVGTPVAVASDGRFRLRVTRMSGPVPVAGPDTVTAVVQASARLLSGTPGRDTAVIRSREVLLRVAPVGAEAPVTDVGTIVLERPDATLPWCLTNRCS